MAKSTKKHLKERWETAQGKKIKQAITKNIKKDHQWERFLKSLPFVEEVFNGKDLRYINLSKADLNNAFVGNANLEGANLSGANLIKANLVDANLADANLKHSRIIKSDISGANLKNAYVYGISSWDIKTENKSLNKKNNGYFDYK